MRWLRAVMIPVALVLGAAGQSGVPTLPVRTDTPAAASLPADAKPEAVAPFVAQVTDGEARRLLVELLTRRAQEAVEPDADATLAQLLRRIRVEGGFAVDRVLAVARTVTYLPGVMSHLLEPLGGAAWMPLGLVLAFGLAAELLVRRMTRDTRPSARQPARLMLLARYALRELGALSSFALAAVAAAFGLEMQDERGMILLTGLMLGIVVARLLVLAGTLALMPDRPALRLLPLSDHTATVGRRWLLVLAALAGFGTAVIAQLGPLDVHGDIALLVTTLVGLSITLLLGAMVWHARRTLAGWHRAAIVYSLLVWALWAINLIAECDTKVMAIAASGAIVAGGVVLDGMVQRRIAEASSALRRAARIVVAVVGVAAFALAWGFDPRWLTAGSGWGAVVGAVVTIAGALLLAWLAWSLIRASIDGRLAPVAVPGEDMVIAGRGQTLLPLVRNVILAVITVITGLVVLSALGVNIGPLLAGAGIVGLAVGFGAQTLVRDIVAGVFFLIDDAFRIGEYVEAGDRRGTVEGMSVRSLRLRHHRGAIHTIPFGELRALTNHSRDWVIFKFELRLPFDTDVVKVRKLIKKIGETMLADEELGPQFLQPLKSQGVTRMDDSALVMAVKFMCRPNEQWQIRREAYNRIQAAFAANGIRFATRHVTVLSAPGLTETGTGEPAGAAARTALAS